MVGETAMNRDDAKTKTGAQDQNEKSGRTALTDCYGRIGIPAVAAALTPRHTEERRPTEPRFTPNDCD